MAFSLLSEMHSWLHKLNPSLGEAGRGKRVLRLEAIVSYTLRWRVNLNCMRPYQHLVITFRINSFICDYSLLFISVVVLVSEL